MTKTPSKACGRKRKKHSPLMKNLAKANKVKARNKFHRDRDKEKRLKRDTSVQRMKKMRTRRATGEDCKAHWRKHLRHIPKAYRLVKAVWASSTRKEQAVATFKALQAQGKLEQAYKGHRVVGADMTAEPRVQKRAFKADQ